jgi:hypothetical protein
MHTLYEKLQLVARYNMQADDVRLIIDEEPIIDTINARDKNTLMIADLSLKEGSVENIRKATRVIYWGVSDEVRDVTIAGLAWEENNNVSFFVGEVLTP